MPIHKVKGGYQWGHQKVYPTRAGAEKQAEAIYASGYGKDNPLSSELKLAEERLAELINQGASSWELVQQQETIDKLREELGEDAEWNESDHPRAENGEFGSGGGGSKKSASSNESVKAALSMWDKGAFKKFSGERETWQTVTSAEQLQAVRFYKNGSKINNALRLNKGNLESLSASEREEVKHLDEAIESSEIQSDYTFFRGVSAKELEELTGEDPAYTSWSVMPHIAQTFADQGKTTGIVLVMSAKKGDHFLPIKGKLGAGLGQTEREMLAPRGMKLRIVKEIQAKTNINQSRHVYVERVDESEQASDSFKMYGQDAREDTSVAAGIMFCTPSGSVLWLKRAADSEAPGCWDFPGGMMEDGETAEEAAVRETEEETSYVPEGTRKEVYDDGFYKTFKQEVDGEFQVVLNKEHVGWCWAPLNDPPQPVHPCIEIMLNIIGKDAGVLEGNSAIPLVGKTKKTGALDSNLALDREVDIDGHLHVASSVISSAQVNDYRAEEIPAWESLGLEAGKVYALLRDPVELEKAVDSFHGKPLLLVHKPVTAGDHDREVVVGSVHNPVWDPPNIKAELTVWDEEAIKLIESGDRSDLSCGYRYRADMTPGEYNGVAYQGVMRDIQGNHLALVRVGRVIGAVVGDSDQTVWEVLESAILGLDA